MLKEIIFIKLHPSMSTLRIKVAIYGSLVPSELDMK